MELREEFLKLLKEDETFRYAVAGYLGIAEILSRIDSNTEAIKNLQEQVTRLQEQVTRLAEQVKTLQEQVAQQGEILRQHSIRIEKLTRTLDAIGSRWGILSESAFREALKGIVEEFFGGRVSRWGIYDREGYVYGYPSLVEVDVLVRDAEHILVEVKSSVSRGDVAELLKSAALYEKEMKVKPKLAIVSAYVDDKAKELAKSLGIAVYSSTEI
ncbi:MAG: DUF3782 domain-containing protein [Candidatus Caldarchaeum sp.]|nr:DUF3782 domain-containing protein [Candidatus Caldarchaeum sp.]MDW8435006.1 DUF3782 domain-containing protein [Candidatus Caldarchaeum sp.]